ncbi:MAG: LytR family transcriptional regulator [Lachnospiraceae bacterium]|nr:LytR family transcriptional regulator [Lachnospiraceae bacterium]
MATNNRYGNRRAVNQRKKQKKRRRKLAAFMLELLVLAVILLGIYVVSLVRKINYNDMTAEEAGINADLDEESLETMNGYTNIAIFGLDNRSEGSYNTGNSDTIMIASINGETHEVKLVSVFRDSVLNVGNDEYKKANSAYAKGGATYAVAMLNTNFDLNITEYVSVDWAAVVTVIDDLGGLDLNLTSQEVELLNTYLQDVDNVTGKNTSYLSGSGEMHLDGTQAVCYARIRKTAGDDYLRTSRQRIVIQALLEKAKTAGVTTLLKICQDTFDDISTSLSLKQITTLAKHVSDYNIAASTGFPFTVTSDSVSGLGSCVIPCTLSTNVSKLHEFLFDETGYQVSATVSGLSATIANMTGYDSESDAIDISRYNDTLGANGTYFKDEEQSTQ